MHPQVHIQDGFTQETLATVGAVVELLQPVDSLVRRQVRFVTEALAAVQAFVGQFSAMESGMDGDPLPKG